MLGRRQTWAKVFFLHMISIKKDLSAYRITKKRLCRKNRQTVAKYEFMLHTYKKFGFFNVVEFLLFINDRSKGLGSVVKKAPLRFSYLRQCCRAQWTIKSRTQFLGDRRCGKFSCPWMCCLSNSIVSEGCNIASTTKTQDVRGSSLKIVIRNSVSGLIIGRYIPLATLGKS